MTAAAKPLDTIGPYRVLRALARGGMAQVYEVEDPRSGEHLALKLLTLQKGNALARFNREYEAMIRLNHPNIVRVYHYGMHEGQPWVTLELLDGQQVQSWVKEVGRPGDPARTREVLRLGNDLARALDHIHRRGLVHRDLKSANVLVLRDGRVKLLDFGTARLVDSLEAITKHNEFLGTFAYAPPEQITGKALDHRADLYSLGCLLYRMLTGVLPFQASDPNELAKLQVTAKPKPMRKLVNVPEALDALVLSLLEKRPSRRPATGAVVADRLEEIAGETLALPGTLDVRSGAEHLVGREEELRRLQGFLDARRPGDAALVLGGPGSGRDRVMRAVEQAASERGLRRFVIELEAGEDLDDLTRLLDEVLRSFGEAPPAALQMPARALRRARLEADRIGPARRREVLRSLAVTVLVARAADGPVAILLRHLHVATPTTLDLLSAVREGLVRHDARVVFVADADAAADDPGRPLRVALPDAERVLLEPLSIAQVALLVGSMLHRRPPPAAIARQIHEASGGEPAYVEEVVSALVDQGLLRVQGRDPNRLEWAQREDLEIPVPDIARHDVDAVLTRLPIDRRRVVEALTVLGGSGPVALIAAALDRDLDAIAPALEELRSRGLIVWHDESVRFRQALAGPLTSVHACRRALLERRLVDGLRAMPVSPSLVRLLVATGRAAEAVAAAIVWGEAHLRGHLPLTALEVLDCAQPVVEQDEVPPSARARFHLLHAACLVAARPTDRRIARSLARARSLVREGAELSLAKAHVQRAIGHYPKYRAQLVEAWDHLKPKETPAVAASVAEQLGASLHMAGLMEEAGEWLQRARALAQQAGDPGGVAQAEVGHAVWVAAGGRLRDGERALARVVRRCNEGGDARGLSVALPAWTHALCAQGRFSEALAWLGRTVPALRQGETPSAHVRMLVASAWCEVELCRLGRAQECVDELAATVRRGEHLHLRLEADLVRGRILLASDDLADALMVLDSVIERARAAELVLLSEHARALRAETLWGLGRYDEAARSFQRAVGRLESTGDVATLAQACRSRARAMAVSVDPIELLAPVREYATSEPAALLRLEWHLATARYLRALGKDPAPACRKARQALDAIGKRLDDTDRAALRVHTWSREIRAGGVDVS